ncbi:MAG: bifunctional 5,10-methylene-tetrahydrofolate dehydrogenase/5,10-methylene-tetrahydrofolate cyclohydrolase [Bacteroidia bacterium]|nr:bifunctional 5,10-methylene-tetrahydrofolate dehydrogenase/5,10-methylene-tetrahydrofolate cyclohydrolase [Bacteroidia bacterium]
MILIDGKLTSQQIKEEIKSKVESMTSSGLRAPHLVAILVGNDGASETYVGNKIRTCAEVGFKSTLLRFDSGLTEEELIAEIHKLNDDEEVDGFIVQLPLPKHIDVHHITAAIDPAKDVDGFHPVNLGRMTEQLPAYIPATPKGIMQLLERYKIETAGRHCVVIGRSNIVGTPMSILLSRNAYPGNCTVTLTHSRTENLKEIARQADILVAAIGKPYFVTADMVKEGAVVIDVGMTRVPAPELKQGFKLAGDVDFKAVAARCSYITPVPGGVGPMTIIGLLQNTLLAAQHRIYPAHVRQ